MTATEVAIDPADVLAELRELIRVAEVRRKAARSGWSAAQYAELYVQVRSALDEIEETIKLLSALKNELQVEGVPKAFEAENIKTLTTTSGLRVTISHTVRASMKDKIKGMEWLRENGYESLIQPTVNASTLAGLAREIMQEGQELPEESFAVHTQPNTSVTRVKKAA